MVCMLPEAMCLVDVTGSDVCGVLQEVTCVACELQEVICSVGVCYRE